MLEKSGGSERRLACAVADVSVLGDDVGDRVRSAIGDTSPIAVRELVPVLG